MLEMLFVIHVTWGLGEVGNYRKSKELPIWERGEFIENFFPLEWGEGEASDTPKKNLGTLD